MHLKIKQILIFNCLVGAMDTLTGLLLILTPVLVLNLLMISDVPQETIYLRFIGAFVASVGSTYLISSLYYQDTFYLTYVKSLWLYTGAIRLSVGTFLLFATIFGALNILWISVALTDLTVAGLQFLSLKKSIK